AARHIPLARGAAGDRPGDPRRRTRDGEALRLAAGARRLRGGVGDGVRARGMIVDIEVRDAGAKGLGVFASLSADEREHLCEIDFERSAVVAASPSLPARTLARERSAPTC